ncbi:MAG: Signal transduction histidine kinase [Thermodesulfobacterium sp.]|uniref:histidine kinase n=1 Tax=Candidatus Thermodesulfobacterium syntrophicum TaxID=3060442 RepID=A0AAE3TFI0_9BACT|nr:Signal transduction histidine kinase [Candidatus Thermodesulfobacterium syntrophicum]
MKCCILQKLNYFETMKFKNLSLKFQLFIAYLTFVIFILFTFFLFWQFSVQLEEKVKYGEKISELLENILEMRRYEKNYLHYHNPTDFENLKKYFSKSKDLFILLKPQLINFDTKETVDKIEKYFISYENILKTLNPLNPVKEKEIRYYGSKILKFAESIKRKEKAILINKIGYVKHLFLFFALFLSLFALTGLLLWYRLLIKSLNTLENEIKFILSGNPRKALVPPEFQHFVDTFKKTYFTLLETEKISSLGKLLFSIAHEINNPLSNISTSIELLKSEELDANFKKELLNGIENEIERTKNIVHSVLDFYKVKDKSFVNLHSCINNSIHLLKGYISSKISLKLDIPQSIEIWGNKSQIQQIFINLIKNAVEAIKGEGEIEIKAFQEKDKIKIIVKDNGEGIPKDYLSRIFEPFFSTKKTGGHGIGLFVVYNLIKEHKGNIWVESEVNKGTTFYIEFPLNKEEIRKEEVYGTL